MNGLKRPFICVLALPIFYHYAVIPRKVQDLDRGPGFGVLHLEEPSLEDKFIPLIADFISCSLYIILMSLGQDYLRQFALPLPLLFVKVEIPMEIRDEQGREADDQAQQAIKCSEDSYRDDDVRDS